MLARTGNDRLTSPADAYLLVTDEHGLDPVLLRNRTTHSDNARVFGFIRQSRRSLELQPLHSPARPDGTMSPRSELILADRRIISLRVRVTLDELD